MKEPHRIGNDGEAPFDSPDPIWSRLRTLADDLDAAVCATPDRTAFYVDNAEVARIEECLEEIADEIFDFCKDRGIAL